MMRLIPTIFVLISISGLFTSIFASENVLVFYDGAMGKVIFDGKMHNEKLGPGKCMECHKDNVPFPMKRPGAEGAAKITAPHKPGVFCGTCHDGKKAFSQFDDCSKCHKIEDSGAEKEIFLVHLKTSLKKDDAQICVAYNMIWAALEAGFKVKVLVDADAVTTFKIGWRGKDDIENYKIPGNLRKALSQEFGVSIDSVPETYGAYLSMLKDRGVEFYINTGFLIVSKIGTPDEPLKKISTKFFKPVMLKEMVNLRTKAKYYMAY
jgi:c(7)-type cytochrome triheme protein